ncbi:MAG: cohesin domain-containing protein [Promethearchaeota archaeon]
MKRKFALGILLIISILTLAFKIELVSAIIPEYPAIYVDPAEIIDPTLVPGTNFTIAIKTDYIGDDINAYQFTLSYDPSILNGVEVVNGDLITDSEGYRFLFVPGPFDNVAGELLLTAAFFFTPDVTATGPGTLANVTFTVVGYGSSNITLGSSTKLAGPDYGIIDGEIWPDHLGHGYFSNEINGVYWTLTVNSNPSGIDFTVDGVPHTTDWSDSLVEGDYTVVMPPTWTDGADVYNFDHWEDASTNPSRTIILNADTTVTAYYVPAPPPERRLFLKLSGDFDYLPKERIKIKLAALVKDADTMEAVSDANVTIDVYHPNGALWVSDNMTERHVGTGIYEWESSDTINEMDIEKDIYLVHVKASVGDGPVATDMLLFHIDPPSDSSNVSSTPLIYYVTVVALIATGTLTGIALFRRYRKLHLAPK